MWTVCCADPMLDARSGSGNTLGSLGIITIGGAVGLVGVFFVVQCYRGWQRWSKARQGGGQSCRVPLITPFMHGEIVNFRFVAVEIKYSLYIHRRLSIY